MSTKIVALFNLKPGISVADYEAWAKAKDIPTVNGLKSVDEFAVFKSVGLLGSEDKPPYAYIEIIDVNDMDRAIDSRILAVVAVVFSDLIEELLLGKMEKFMNDFCYFYVFYQ